MKIKHISCLAVLLPAFFLSGCVTKVIKDVEEDIQSVRVGPREMPKRNITDFADSLRCMDDLFITFGFSQNTYVMLLEDFKDKTEKVKAGTREMMISAISDMTRRSQAIQVVAFGNDAGNLVAFMQSAEQSGAYQNIPPYDIIGSVSQLDKDLVRKQADFGGQTGGTIDGKVAGGGFGVSASNAGSVLGLDLSVITTNNIAVIPYKSGKGGGFDAGISKTGINYSISSSQSDGTAQALRALVELSTIELVGKLAKLPYWNCLGQDPEHENIRREISDWHYQLTQAGAIHTEAKVHLYLRGYYDGPLDETITPEYQAAVVEYKKRLGLPAVPGVDINFYSAFLNDSPTSVDRSRLAYIKHKKREGQAKTQAVAQKTYSGRKDDPVVVQKVSTVKTVEPADEPLSLTIESASVTGVYAPGENVVLTVKTNDDGYVDCYMESGEIYARIFPNRFSADGYIADKGMITLPDSPAYSITSDKDGEKIHCLFTTRRIDTDLPGELRVADFESLPVSSPEDIFAAYRKASNGRFAQSTYTIKVQ